MIPLNAASDSEGGGRESVGDPTSAITVDEAAAIVTVMRDSIGSARDLRPSRFRCTSIGQETVLGMYERATGLARAVNILISGGHADEAAPQVRSLLEVSVVLGHAAAKSQDLNHLALIVAHYSIQQELCHIVGADEESRRHRQGKQRELEIIGREASKAGVKLRAGELNPEALARRINREAEVRLVYRRTSQQLHLTRTALFSRVVEQSDRMLVMPNASLWAEAAMAELTARLFTGAAYAAAHLLGWDTTEEHEALARNTEERLRALTEPIAARRSS